MRFLLIGNCQVQTYALFLRSNNYQVDYFCSFVDEVTDSTFSKCYDVCIYQSNKSINYEKAIHEFTTCKFIRVPSLMFTLYFPDVDLNYFHFEPASEYPYGYICYKRNRLCAGEKNTRLTPEYVSDYLRSLISKDACYTVPIYKYIAENFMIRRLFHTYNHPKNELLNLVCTSIVDKLGLTIHDNLYTGQEVFGFYQDAIFKDDASTLQLRFISKIIIHSKEITFDEFKEYHNQEEFINNDLRKNVDRM